MNNVVAGYGDKIVVRNISCHIASSEIVGLVGPNGSGKSTVVKTIYGLVSVKDGEILFQNKEIQNRKPSINAEEGIGYIPQGNKIFDRLTVEENLELGGFFLKDKKMLQSRIEDVYSLFPILKSHRKKIAGKMSGGERQMLGIGRGLIMNPKLILLDEPSIGLAPRLVSLTMETISTIRQRFSITLLVVEQNVREVLKIVDRVYVLKLGEIVFEETHISRDTEDALRRIFL